MAPRPISAGTRRLALLAGCALGLAGGCVGAPGAGPVAPAAGTRFDGTYAGQDSLLGGVAFQCGEPSRLETIAVHDGRFDYPFPVNPPRTTPLPVQIAADGTFWGQMQYGTEDFTPRARYRTDWVTVAGRITGNGLEATMTNERCLRRLMAQRG
jgi:hypothetical protein